MKNQEKVKQGKRNKAKGAAFERKVRADLESKGWIVSKWQNNITFGEGDVVLDMSKADPEKGIIGQALCNSGKCVPAKAGRFRLISVGYPDFIIYMMLTSKTKDGKDVIDTMTNIKEEGITKLSIKPYGILFAECKSDGYLSKEEREKAEWYLINNYCSAFIIAKKGKKRGEIEYIDFKEKYGGENEN